MLKHAVRFNQMEDFIKSTKGEVIKKLKPIESIDIHLLHNKTALDLLRCVCLVLVQPRKTRLDKTKKLLART